MSRRRVFVLVGAWLLAITALHLGLNVSWAVALNDLRPKAERKLNVAYVPVTCHLACPVTDYISRHALDGNLFIPKMFQGFPEIKEALISNRVQAGFLVAPTPSTLSFFVSDHTSLSTGCVFLLASLKQKKVCLIFLLPEYPYLS